MNSTILQFLIKSRQSTYASGEKAKVIDRAKNYIIKEGNLEYRDSYYDQHSYFQGQEVILQDGEPIWSMSYRGAATSEEPSKVFKVLKKLIKENADQVRFHKPFEKEEGEYKYSCSGEGNLNEFRGLEEIYQNNTLSHWMRYFGGQIK